jgi:hypothetical protein
MLPSITKKLDTLETEPENKHKTLVCPPAPKKKSIQYFNGESWDFLNTN